MILPALLILVTLFSLANLITLVRVHLSVREVRQLAKDLRLMGGRVSQAERWIETIMRDIGYRNRSSRGLTQEDHDSDRGQRRPR